MADDSSPDQALARLWRLDPPGRRGPRPSRDLDTVVDAAIGIADESGLQGLTMRGLAERVGVSTMSLYTYVPTKEELADLMLDRCWLSMSRPPWRSRSWRRRLTTVAESNRDLLLAHPWILRSEALSRPPLGPGMMAKYEHELAAFDGTGLDDVTIDSARTFLLGFVHDQAAARSRAKQQIELTDQDDQAWWAANAPVLERILDSGSYPRATRVGTAAGQAQGSAYAPETAWRFGLARVLDGLSTLINPQ